MDESITFNQIKGLSFKVYSPEEILKLSELEITNVEILDVLGNPVPEGLYDLRLGPNERDDICGTCRLDYMSCAGHAGHIELPVPVFSPVFFTQLYQLLRGSCFTCHRLLAPPVSVLLTRYQLAALDHGLVGTVHELAEVLTDPSQTDNNDTSIQAKLQNKFEEALIGVDPNEKCNPVRSVIETRIQIVKSFVKNYMMGAKGKCPHCRSPVRKLTRYNLKIVYREYQRDDDNSTNKSDVLVTKELTPLEARKHLHLLWEQEQEFLQQLFKVFFYAVRWESPAIDMFLMTRIMVPPSRFRRLNVMKGKKYADVQTMSFNEVQKDCQAINRLSRKMVKMELTIAEKEGISKLPGKTDSEKFSNAYNMLQRHIYEIFDSDINKERNKTCKGIKQILEKKEGLFRMNMMGKRVNFAARSVISSDPYIMVNEIGLPLVFAKKLTFPEPVNYWNVEKLRRAVINGPNVHPGACMVEMEDGRRVRLPPDDISRRRAMAKTLLTPSPSAKIIGAVKTVHRHVRNGDMLLLNRQPTLHKPSIMAHKARVLPGEKTLRLHYANCKSYNADFDGDEMNAHLPQSYLGQAECQHIVGVNHQFLVPKDGTPLSGLIQDHIVAGVLLTMRGRFFNREQYHQLIYSAMSFHRKRLKLLPPSILKPEVLWSGKQVVSTVIINLLPEGKVPLTVEGKAKVSSKNWKTNPAREWLAGGTPLKGDAMSESEVIIRNGELLCGVIDKAHVGPTPYGMVHVCYELYGGETSSVILTALARLFTHYLQYYSGFSLGIEDIVVNRKPNKIRRRILRKGPEKGLEAAAKALNVEDPQNETELLSKYRSTHYSRDDTGLKVLDMEMKSVTGSLNKDINEVCIPSGLRKKFPQNNLQLMIESGAKGASVNAIQISCLLGQIELEGRRMPLMLNGSTLPSFRPYDTSPAAGGFVSGRFMTGINPQEYFFHCMAGREGLIDTAVKTSRSGYLQRCLIKNLEGISVQYDHTVRDSDGTVIQFLYGEDGLDPMKMQFLKEGRLNALSVNYHAAINENEIQTFKKRFEVDLSKEKKKIKRWQKKHRQDPGYRVSPVDSVTCHSMDIKRRLQELEHIKNALQEEGRNSKTKKCPDPVLSMHRPQLTFGCVSENLDSLISEYISKNPQHLLWDTEVRRNAISKNQFQDMCYYRTLRSLVEPGETVGILAAQSIGEPSTQMTLNTFHFAGKGEMNVTLGIPRIREILMTASPNIATPTMDLPLLDLPGARKKAERLKLKLNPAALKDVLDSVKIKEYLSIPSTLKNTRNYVIKMNFLKHSEYKDFVNTSPSKVLAFIEKVFVKKLVENLKKKRKVSSTSRQVDIMKDTSNLKSEVEESEDVDAPSPAAEGRADDGESSAESEGEGDTTSAKSRMRHNQDQSYEEPEEEEMLPESDAENDVENVEIKEEASDEEETKFDSNNFVFDGEKADRVNTVKSIHSWVSGYDFDSASQLWCEIMLQLPLDSLKIDMKSLVEEEINKCDIHSVPHIKKAILVEDSKSGQFTIKTDGVNFLEIFKYVDILDLNKAYSNNIHEIANIYGIEAATRAIRREIVNVFAAYGIQVDPHHLSLVADFMTSSGRYRPCNRLGIEGHASPLQQMTFETTKNFMVDSMLMGVEDQMKSPSASIIVGQLPRCGTGSFSLIQKFSGACNEQTLSA